MTAPARARLREAQPQEMRGELVPRRDHGEEERPDGKVDRARRQHEEGPGARGRRERPGGRVGREGAPVDLPPPRQDARGVRHHGRDGHDGHGFPRPVDGGQHGHEQDRRARADDAADETGDEADSEDEEETHAAPLAAPGPICTSHRATRRGLQSPDARSSLPGRHPASRGLAAPIDGRILHRRREILPALRYPAEESRRDLHFPAPPCPGRRVFGTFPFG